MKNEKTEQYMRHEKDLAGGRTDDDVPY